jgi:hypothetical protein
LKITRFDFFSLLRDRLPKLAFRPAKLSCERDRIEIDAREDTLELRAKLFLDPCDLSSDCKSAAERMDTGRSGYDNASKKSSGEDDCG